MGSGNGTDSSRGALPPIAIIGIGCRFPGGGTTPAKFWQLLVDEVDAVGEIMPDRWDEGRWYSENVDAQGRVYTRSAGVIDEYDGFDADFFGISPREALVMDPQQRVILEVAWEAMEDAGIVPRSLAGSDTGVVVGICQTEYATLQSRDTLTFDSATNTGGAMSIAANRISYLFDLHGPSYAVDTACSSSLVAVDAACKTLWRGDAPLMLAGGINLMVSTEASVGFSRAKMLSPTGRCRPFSADADGYVRSEGAGVLVLKRLDQAVADGDRIYATIAATGVNQDGRTNGLSLPNRKAQAALIKQVLAESGLSADQIQYVEAHGTGTPVGDPLECYALGQSLGKQRTNGRPIPIGSVKSNVGHLEGASGMAGLIKLALSLYHRQIPANAHFNKPNPRIPFEKLNLCVQEELADWPEGDPIRLGCINSFGFGGTNGHAILQEAPAPVECEEEYFDDRAEVLLVSARNADSLNRLAQDYQSLLDEDEHELSDLCAVSATRVSAHTHRLAMVGKSPEEISEMIDAFVAGERRPGLASSKGAVKQNPKIAFVFSGNGPQWWGMARQLLANEPVFREVVEACDQGMRPLVDWSLLEELGRDEESTRLELTEIAQPTLFAVQMGLVALLKHWGVQPSVVFGHSVGEVAAAACAGMLDFESAIRVIYHRSHAQGTTAGTGSMAAVGLSAEDAHRAIQDYDGKLTVAAINSAEGVTISGDTDALDAAVAKLEGEGTYCQKLRLDYAFHSHHMEPLRDSFSAAIADVKMHTPNVRFISTAHGREITEDVPGSDYWWDNIRQPVQFFAASQLLADEEIDAIVEVGPHPVVSSYVAEAMASKGKAAAVVPTLRRYADDRGSLLTTIASLFTLGHDPNWKQIYPRQNEWIDLPEYPWKHERFWNIPPEVKQVHPLLGLPQNTAEATWQQQISDRLLPYLADHRFEGTTVFPAAGYVELCLAAGHQLLDSERVDLDQLDILRALTLGEHEICAVQVNVEPDHTVYISGKPRRPDSEWSTHAKGKLRQNTGDLPNAVDVEQLKTHFTATRETRDHFAQTARRGLDYGPAFQGIQTLWLGDGEALAEISVTELAEQQYDQYFFHPAMLDACFQTVFGVIGDSGRVDDASYLPVQVRRFRMWQRCGQRVFCHVQNVRRSARYLAVDLAVVDEDGQPVATVEGLTFQEVETGLIRDERLQFELEWIDEPTSILQQPVASHLPHPEKLATQLSALSTVDRNADLNAALQALDDLSLASIHDAVASLAPSLEFTIEQLVSDVGVLPELATWMTALLEQLKLAGLAEESDGRWRLKATDAGCEPETRWRAVTQQYSSLHLELMSVWRSGRRLVDVLCGRVDVRDVLFVTDGPAPFQLFELGDSYQAANRRLRATVSQALNDVPEGAALSVLIVNATLGGVVPHVLDVLRDHDARCVLTDASDESLIRLQSRFQHVPNLEFAKLDLTKPIEDQELADQEFDLILVARDFWGHSAVESMQRTGSLLAEQGLLIFAQPSLATPTNQLLFGAMCGCTDRSATCGTAGLAQPAVIASDSSVDELLLATTQPSTVTETLDGSKTLLAATSSEVSDAIDTEESPSWLVFIDQDPRGQQLVEQFQAANIDVHVVTRGADFDCSTPGRYVVNPTNRQDFLSLLQTTEFKFDGLAGIAFLWGLDVSTFDASVDVCAGLTNLVQAIDETQQECRRLWIVMDQVAPSGIDGSATTLYQSTLLGLGRVIRNERPDLHSTMLTLAADQAPSTQDLAELLFREDDESEILLSCRGRQVRRLNPLRPPAPLKRSEHDLPFRLSLDHVGQLQNFRFREVPRRELASGDVEIEVRAAGLNFKDVMWAMGMLPGEVMANSFAGPCFGFECAGVVSAVGKGVDDFQVGDEVMAFAPHSIGRYAVTIAEAICKKPASVSFEEAATVPVTFLTAEYALSQLGRVQPGERVLIHGGAGGVGMAAIQIVSSMGGEVFATAGSEEKREYLRNWGVPHVFNSRSLDFADQVMAATNGEGIDVVLNSLAGDAMDRSLSLLRPFGRFLEIGKRDFVENSRLRLRPFQNNISFFGIDADQLLKYQPAIANQVLQSVLEKFADGRYQPLAHVAFPASRAADAFRYMQRSQHIGKVVVDMSDETVAVDPQPPASARFKQDGTYVVIGGLGGLGRSLARWLSSNGAGNVVLVGRSLPSEEAATEVASLKERGVNVVAAQADVADRQSLQSMLDGVRRDLPPIRGVVHAAMVLDDAALNNLDRDRFEKVMACKTVGAWNLHQLTQDDPLDHFVLFSSFSSVMGNPGQGNYAAANAFLDELAALRTELQQPVLTINWGLFGSVGYAAEQDELVERFARIGVHAIDPQQAFRILGDRMADSAHPQFTVSHLRWNKWRQLVKKSVSPTWAHLAQGASGDEGADEGFLELLEQTPPEQRFELFRQRLTIHFAAVLGTSVERLDVDRPITELGLDSLMAVELRTKLESDMGVELSMMKVFAGESISSLAASLLRSSTSGGSEDAQTDESPATVDSVDVAT